MKIFNKYNFNVDDKIISREEFRLLPHFRKDALNKDRLDSLIARADEDLEAPIPSLNLSDYRAYNITGSTATYGSPYRRRMDMALRLAMAEIHTKDGKYFDKMLDAVWAMLDEPTWMLPEHTYHMPEEATVKMPVPAAVGEKYAHGIELGSAYRSALIALIYHYFEDQFNEISPFINERIVYTLKARAIDPFCKYYFQWEGMGGNRVNNWCPWIVSNILLTTALIEDDMSVRETVVKRSMTFLDNFINCYKSDGGCDEGPTYWNAAAGCLFDCLELLEDFSDGLIDVYSEPLIKAMGEYAPRMNITGRYFVNFADSRCTCGYDGNMLRRYGEKCGSQILESFGDSMLKNCGVGFDVAIPYRSLRSFTTSTRDMSDKTLKASTDTYFPDLKVMVLRESEKSGEGLFFAMKGGNNDESHNHNDVGSFIVYNNGQPVLIDAGVGEYTKQTFSKDRYKIWSMQSLYHNLPSFDGKGQLNGAKYCSKNEVYDKDARSLTVDVTDAYDEACGVVSFIRSGSLQGSKASITDKIELADEKDIDFVFITHVKPEIIKRGELLLNTGARFIYDENLEVRIEPFEPVGMKKTGSWGTDSLYRIHLTVRDKSCEYTFNIHSK